MLLHAFTPLLNFLLRWYAFLCKCPNSSLLLEAVANVDGAIAPVVVQRVKRQLLLQNPLYEAIALQPDNPKIAGCTEAIAVILVIPVLLMRHVLISTRINPPILNTRLRIFLAQKTLQVL